jgi:multidrug efflux pump
MTVVLIAVYVPIGFQGGLTGALFTEFAFTLVGAVTVSAVIALTLSPMMCSRLLKPPHRRRPQRLGSRLVRFIDARFERVRSCYQRGCSGSLNYTAGDAVSSSSCWAASTSCTQRQERAGAAGGPGRRLMLPTSAPNATLQQKQLYARAVYETFARIPETDHVFQIDSPGQSIAGMVLKPLGPAQDGQRPAAAR